MSTPMSTKDTKLEQEGFEDWLLVRLLEFAPDRLNSELVAFTDRILAAHKAELLASRRAALLDFAEYCHEHYLGCAQNNSSPTEFEYAYDNEVVILAETYAALTDGEDMA